VHSRKLGRACLREWWQIVGRFLPDVWFAVREGEPDKDSVLNAQENEDAGMEVDGRGVHTLTSESRVRRKGSNRGELKAYLGGQHLRDARAHPGSHSCQ
jgi:hypothetical protein